jgi:S-adenosylmethionine/arginine decarboxylase-like enzyme
VVFRAIPFFSIKPCDVDNDGSCLTSRPAALEDTTNAADGRIRREYTALESFTDQHDDSNDQTTDAVYYEPAGQHLLVDFEEVDRSFLQSEARLAHAMIDLIQTSSMTMLSYYCHSASGNGDSVSCVGVLLESHVSVHTWPRLGRLVLDLFSCSSLAFRMCPAVLHSRRYAMLPVLVG